MTDVVSRWHFCFSVKFMDVSLLVAERPPEPSRYEDRGAEAHLSSAKKKVQEGE